MSLCQSVSLCVYVCDFTGLKGHFTINKEDGREGDFQLNIIQESGILPIGVYHMREKRVVLYEGTTYLWPGGKTAIPREWPFCFKQSCYYIST